MKTFLPNLFTDPTHVRDPFATLRRHIDDLATSFGHAWPSQPTLEQTRPR